MNQLLQVCLQVKKNPIRSDVNPKMQLQSTNLVQVQDVIKTITKQVLDSLRFNQSSLDNQTPQKGKLNQALNSGSNENPKEVFYDASSTQWVTGIPGK